MTGVLLPDIHLHWAPTPLSAGAAGSNDLPYISVVLHLDLPQRSPLKRVEQGKCHLASSKLHCSESVIPNPYTKLKDLRPSSCTLEGISFLLTEQLSKRAGVVHGPNGTAIKETDTTTLGGADNYKKIHDSHGVVGPKQIDLGGGKNTFLDNKNSSAGCKALPHSNTWSIEL